MVEAQKSNKELAKDIGERLKQARLNANLTQGAVAQMAGISRTGVASAESGMALLETMIAIMRALNLLDQLNLFLPAQPISPVQLAKLQGRKRQRASNAAPKKSHTGGDTW